MGTTRRSRKAQVQEASNIAVGYVRVSSLEQEKEGFSVPAQVKTLKDYSVIKGLSIAEMFADVETAKVSGRPEFARMIDYLKKHSSVKVILVEKTSRLYRNFRDVADIQDLDVELHLIKENEILRRDSRSHQKLIHGFKVVMAKQYVDNLGEEASKGMLEKAEQGIWPSYAPTGYMNVPGLAGKRIVDPDPSIAPLVTKVFEWYASRSYSIREVAAMARNAGLKTRTGQGITTATIHNMLRKRIYTGVFDWKGKAYQGNYTPLVSKELWGMVGDSQPALRQEVQEGEARLRILGNHDMRALRLFAGRRTQEGEIRLLPLHRLQAEVSRAIRTGGGPGRTVRQGTGPPGIRRGGPGVGP